MAQPLSTEERLAALEKEVVELKQQLTERLSFEGLRADVKELQIRYQAHEEYVTDRLNNFEEHVETRLNLMDMRLDVITTRLDTVEENLTGQLNEQKAAMEKLQDRHVGATPPRMKKSRIGEDASTQRSRPLSAVSQLQD